MSQLNALLDELRQTTRDERAHQLAVRYAPILRFDTREPFLPLAAGITLFEADGPSPSMKRAIQLAPPGKAAAAAAIEYAIWWDWDIHHLYELEHLWVYLDEQGQVVRFEGSWHGEFNELAVQLEGEHPLVLSEPGKHAFADRPEPFLQRAAEVRRPESQHVGALAHVLINSMFSGKIRRRPYDNSLARAHLVTQAFVPAWDFSQVFLFEPDSLVTWPALAAWIPRRVNTWLEELEAQLAPSEYRALRLLDCDGSPAALQAALDGGADGVMLAVVSGPDGQPATTGRPAGGAPDTDDVTNSLLNVFHFCSTVPMGAVIDLQEESCIEPLAAFLNDKKVHSLVPVTAANPAWLARLKALAPRAAVLAQLTGPDQDPQAAAAACQAAGVLLNWPPAGRPALNAAWVERAHAAGLIVMSWPAASLPAAGELEHQRVDILWYKG
jgi:hypothetical protein